MATPDSKRCRNYRSRTNADGLTGWSPGKVEAGADLRREGGGLLC